MDIVHEMNLDLLNSIKDGFKYNEKEYEQIVKNSSEILMSKTKGESFYGMFFPCERLSKIFIYKGKLVDNEAESDFTYYFDKDKRLVLTKRQFNEQDLSLIFYYYHESYIDVIWFSVSDNEVETVGRIEVPEGVLTNWLVSDIFEGNKIIGYHEYYFTIKKGWVYERSFIKGFMSDGSDVEKVTPFVTKYDV